MNNQKKIGICIGIIIVCVLILRVFFDDIDQLIKFSSDNAVEIAQWASLIGVPIGIGAIVYAYFIKQEVHNISKKQQENAQGPYKLNTSKNLNEIHKYFKEIIRITKNAKLDDELEESKNNSEINAELKSYYQAEKPKMQMLLDKSTPELKAWSDLDQSLRLKFEEVIINLQWLINDFFEVNQDEEMQIRIWTENHKELTSKKFDIEEILKINKEMLS